jgi:hypothetical protein
MARLTPSYTNFLHHLTGYLSNGHLHPFSMYTLPSSHLSFNCPMLTASLVKFHLLYSTYVLCPSTETLARCGVRSDGYTSSFQARVCHLFWCIAALCLLSLVIPDLTCLSHYPTDPYSHLLPWETRRKQRKFFACSLMA